MNTEFQSLRNLINAFERSKVTEIIKNTQYKTNGIDEDAELLRAFRFVKDIDRANDFSQYILKAHKNSGSWPLICEVAFLYIAQRRFDDAYILLTQNYFKHDHMEKLCVLAKTLKYLNQLEFSNDVPNKISNQEFSIKFNEILISSDAESIIRIGDGEALFWGVLNIPFRSNILDYVNFVADQQYEVWFGESMQSATHRSINFINSALFSSYNSSNLIGCHDFNRANEIFETYAFSPYRNYFPGYFGFISTYFLIKTLYENNHDLKVFDPYIFLNLIDKNKIEQLIDSGKKLCFISCHDFSAIWPNRVELIQIPAAQGESLPDKLKGNGMHYPERFNEVMKLLDTENFCRNKIFFVGAGILAKIYCSKIKENGGVAFDVGSSLDYMLGYATRTVYK